MNSAEKTSQNGAEDLEVKSFSTDNIQGIEFENSNHDSNNSASTQKSATEDSVFHAFNIDAEDVSQKRGSEEEISQNLKSKNSDLNVIDINIKSGEKSSTIKRNTGRRAEPTLKLGVYGSLGIEPDQALPSFIESKLHNEFYHKKPLWDVPREGLQHDAIESERELFEMLKQQEDFKRGKFLQEKISEERVKGMHEAQLKLHQDYIETNEFLKGCMEKINRAETLIETQLKEQGKLKEEIEVLDGDVNEFETFGIKFQGIAKEMQPFEDVLIETVEASSLYNSCEDLMTRGFAMMLIQSEVEESEQELLERFKDVREQMRKLTQETSQKIMKFMGEIEILEKTYKSAKDEVLKLEKILANTKDCIAANETESIFLSGSIQHLYQMLAKRNGGIAAKEGNDISAMVDYICTEVKLLESIIKRSHFKMAKHESEFKSESSMNGK